jgi:hypothetical protein
VHRRAMLCEYKSVLDAVRLIENRISLLEMLLHSPLHDIILALYKVTFNRSPAFV